jgi:hypothetical protein
LLEVVGDGARAFCTLRPLALSTESINMNRWQGGPPLVQCPGRASSPAVIVTTIVRARTAAAELL